MFYLRKLSNNPNYEKLKNAVDVGELGSDILKQEFGTTNNTLSFWKCECLDSKKDTIKAVLLADTGIKASRFFVLSDEILDKYGFKMDDTELGKTGYKGFAMLHINMTELTYTKIGLVMKMLNEVFQNSDYSFKIDRETIKAYIQEVMNDGLLDENNTNEHLLTDINRYVIQQI